MIINIESIFTAFELSKTLGRFPGFNPDQIDGLIDDLKSLIVTTLEHTVTFPVSGGGVVGPHSAYLEFIQSIEKAAKGASKSTVAILSFNYDIALDFAVFAGGYFGIDYGIEKEPQIEPRLPVLKLHGSLNWASSAGNIVPWFLEDYVRSVRSFPPARGGNVSIPVGSQIDGIGQRKKELANVDKTPIIVPPSWNKADSHRAVARVWARAAKELSEADSIYIVGYSLPATDSFFHHLYALGSVGNTLLKRFWVFNPDASREGVFRSMLGPGARSRFKFFDQRFSKATRTIGSALE